MDIEALEARYGERARSAIAAQADRIELVLPDRSPPPPAGSGLALAGWWVDEASAGDRVVLPNPYDGVEAIATMEAWVWGVSQRLAPRLGERLDATADRSPRGVDYWRVLLSPWLVLLLSALADRRLYCRTVSELVPHAPFVLPTVPEPPATTSESLWRLRTDAGNGGLLATIAPHLGILTTRAVFGAPPTLAAERSSRVPALRDLRTDLTRVASGAALASLPGRSLGLVGLTRLNASDLVRLEARVRGVAPLPRPTLRRSGPRAPIADSEARARLVPPGLDGSVEPLERLALEAMPVLLPRSLLEGFDKIERESRRRYGRAMHVVVGNYSVDESQNEFLARCRAAGRRLAFAQHGGMYLQSPVNAQERLEIEAGSLFMSWGASGPAVAPTPNPYLERLRDSHRGGTRITIVEALEPPDAYLLRFAGHPLANQGYAAARTLAEMVELLPSERRVHLALRRFPSAIGPPSRPKTLEDLPASGPPGGAADWMASSRLAVIPYLDTPFIEAMVIGTPTVGLWNPSRWPLLAELEPLFGRLREAGILHAEAASAAAHIDAIYDDAGGWWTTPEVLALRAEFVQRFAVPGDWLGAWSRQLRELRR